MNPSENIIVPTLDALKNPYPQGTQVVLTRDINGERFTPSGSVATVLSYSPTLNIYAVTWANGGSSFVAPEEIEVRRTAVVERLQEFTSKPVALNDDFRLTSVLFTCVVGSKAFGLDGPDSDIDIRGVFQLDADAYRSLTDPVTMIGDKDEHDEEYWELKHFLQMALKANPNILEALYSPISYFHNEVGHELRAERSRLLSRHTYTTYNGYVASQYKKLEQDLRTKGEIKNKHAMHLIRLLLSGIHLVRHGEPLIDVGDFRDMLLSIKNGDVSWETVQTTRLKLHAEFEDAFVHTALPAQPDYAWANDFLIRARRSLDRL